MQIPCGSRRLVSLAILATASDYLQPSEIYTHMDGRARTHAVHADRCHGYIKAETANFDQLLTVMGVRQWGYRGMVKQGASLTSALYFNWQP